MLYLFFSCLGLRYVFHCCSLLALPPGRRGRRGRALASYAGLKLSKSSLPDPLSLPSVSLSKAGAKVQLFPEHASVFPYFFSKIFLHADSQEIAGRFFFTAGPVTGAGSGVSRRATGGKAGSQGRHGPSNRGFSRDPEDGRGSRDGPSGAIWRTRAGGYAAFASTADFPKQM